MSVTFAKGRRKSVPDSVISSAFAEVSEVAEIALQYGQQFADQWHWDEDEQKPVFGSMAIPQVVRHQPTKPLIEWFVSIFYDANRTLTYERREMVARALSDGKYVETNDLAVISAGPKAVLMNFHHRASVILKHLLAGGELETAISVYYGIPFDNIEFMDTGKPRSTLQIAKIMRQDLPPRSVPLVKVLIDMLAESRILRPDEQIGAIQCLLDEIQSVRDMLGNSRDLRQPVVEAAFVSAYCSIKDGLGAEAELEKLRTLTAAMQNLLTADEPSIEPSMDDPAELAGNAIINRVALFDSGKKNGTERTTAFYLIQEGIYRYLKGERFLQLRPKTQGFAPQYPLPRQITEAINIKSRFEAE